MLQEEETICDICQNVVKQPVSCSSCNTIFCSDCIKTFIFINKCCFTCNTQQPKLKLLMFNEQDECVESIIYVKSIFLDVQVPCYNHIYGCEQKMLFEMLDKHLESCPFKTCICLKCNVKVRENKFQQHQKKCPNKDKNFPKYESLESLMQKFSEIELIYNSQVNQLLKKNYALEEEFQLYEDILETGYKLPIQQVDLFKRTILQCSKGHPLQWIKKFRSVNHKCEQCKQPQTPLRYTCQECEVYFCQRCKFRLNNCAQRLGTRTSNGICPKNHIVSYIPKLKQSSDLQCDVCEKFIKQESGFAFQDNFCDFVICSTCNNQYQVQTK